MSADKRGRHLDRCLHLDIELPKNVALKRWNHIGGKVVDRIRRHCQGDLVLNQESMPLLPGTDLAPKRAFFHTFFTTVRTDSFMSTVDTMLVEDILQTEVSDAARHSPPPHTYPPFLTPSSTLSHHSLSPSTNLLSASLLDTRPSYRPN